MNAETKKYTITGINGEGDTEHWYEAKDSIDAVIIAKDLVGEMMTGWDKFTIEVEAQ